MIAIDGPAGAGKSTVSRAAALRLSLPHIDTGAIYRAMTLKAIRLAVPLDDGNALGALASETAIDLQQGKTILDGGDVSTEIRSPAVTKQVSRVSAHPQVRSRMIRLQRELVGESGAVVEGRDIGTVVLPNADLKIFLTASPTERARRRTADLSEAQPADPEQVLGEILQRDRHDSERPHSPLAVARDALVIDSTEQSVDEIVDDIERLAAALKR